MRLWPVAFQSQWSGSSKNLEHLPLVWLFLRKTAILTGHATLHTFYSTRPTSLAISDETEWLQPISWHGAISAQEGNRILDGVAESPLSWELCKEEQLVAGVKAEWHSEAVRTKSTRAAKCRQWQTARADRVKSWCWRERTRFCHWSHGHPNWPYRGWTIFQTQETQLQDGSWVSTGLAMRLQPESVWIPGEMPSILWVSLGEFPIMQLASTKTIILWSQQSISISLYFSKSIAGMVTFSNITSRPSSGKARSKQ